MRSTLDRRRFLVAGGLAAAGAAAGFPLERVMAPAARAEGATPSAALAIGPATVATHPLDPLTADEIQATFVAIERDSRFPSDAFFPAVMLKEPPKADVLAWSPGKPLGRRAFAQVYARSGNKLYEVVIDLATRQIVSWVLRPGVQPPVFGTGWGDADAIVRANAEWKRAIRNRGLEPDDIYIDVWAPGEVPTSIAPAGTRALRALAFWAGTLGNPYDRPVEGLVVTIDMNRRRVVHVADTGIRPVNTTLTGNATSPITGLKPIVVSQPSGPSWTIDGRLVSWLGWRFRVNYTPREGLVLHQIGWHDGTSLRPIVYRLSLSEIYVPYALPDPNWSWRTAFDIGEYN